MNSYNNLIDKIVSKENMELAYKRTSNAKRMTWGYLEFKEYKQINLDLLAKEMASGEYKIGGYREFVIYEPKPRLISALDFKDRLVQHAVVAIIEPIFEATFLPSTFACRKGLGTHAGVKYIQAQLRKENAPKFYLKTDFSKFFPSVDHNILLEMVDKKITCERTLKIIKEIIKPNEVGIPIGSLTSQLFANVYGSKLDMFIQHELKCKQWARYMDDVVILDNDKNRLLDYFSKIKEFSESNLKLKISKWHCGKTSNGINFLGYRIWKTHKLLRKDSVTRAKRKIKYYITHNKLLDLDKFAAAWAGHARWANTNNLYNWIRKKYNVII